eukprot:g26443.t1
MSILGFLQCHNDTTQKFALISYSLPTDMTDPQRMPYPSPCHHLHNKDTSLRLLLVDYISIFNPIIPSRLISRLQLRKFGMSIRTLTNFYRCT